MFKSLRLKFLINDKWLSLFHRFLTFRYAHKWFTLNVFSTASIRRSAGEYSHRQLKFLVLNLILSDLTNLVHIYWIKLYNI